MQRMQRTGHGVAGGLAGSVVAVFAWVVHLLREVVDSGHKGASWLADLIQRQVLVHIFNAWRWTWMQIRRIAAATLRALTKLLTMLRRALVRLLQALTALPQPASNWRKTQGQPSQQQQLAAAAFVDAALMAGGPECKGAAVAASVLANRFQHGQRQ